VLGFRVTGFEWLPEAFAKSELLAKSLGVGWSVSLGAPASEEVLTRCEASLGERLAPSHRALLSLHNGASLTIILSRERSVVFDVTVNILSTADIAATTSQLKCAFFSDLPAEQQPRFYAIAEYQGCGDHCMADPARSVGDETPIVDAFNETPDEWSSSPIIANSFEDWMRKMFDSFLTQHCTLEYWMHPQETIAELVDRWHEGRSL
jgi:hypothetical protein